MSNPPPVSSKAVSNAPQISQAQAQAGSFTTGDTIGQRRSGGSGSFGPGASSRNTSSPRNAQASRKQHKPSKRVRLVDDDAIVESGIMRSTTGRKGQTSITHLMNFSLPPRPQQHHGNGHRPPRRTWGLGSGYHAADKARYVHANYRFVVDPRANYHTQSIDADIHLDWNSVLQILASAQSQEASCPICLGTPVAPRMAKCGHIFCLPCLIRYMHSEDSTTSAPEKKARWKKCPICYDSIYISETRPVRWYIGQEGEPPQEGMDVVLRLVTRAAGSTLALPRDGAEALGKDEDIPWHVAAEVMDYARMLKGSEDYMLSQYDNDIHELEKQEKEDEVMFGEDNVEWMRKAIRLLRESKEKMKGIGNPPNQAKPAEPKPQKAPIVFNDLGAPEMYQMRSAARSGQSMPADQTPSSKNDRVSGVSQSTQDTVGNTSALHQQHSASQTPTEYYFYQALLHYYLSPLDIRILKSAFGSFAAFPSTILPRVEHISTGHVVDDELRKRTKYLAHLPYGCEVAFLECDWTDTVAPDILARFAPEIDRRRKKNQEKLSREEKSRLRAERAESEQYRRTAASKRPSAQDRFSADDFAPLGAAPSPGTSAPSTTFDDIDESSSTSPPWPNRRNATLGSAFASLASPSTSPSASRTVWGTTAVAPTSPSLLGAHPDVEVDDGWLQGWEKDLLAHDDDVAAQVAALSLAESMRSGAAGPSSSSNAAAAQQGQGQAQAVSKKGKKKKITLMSTNVRRGA